MMKTLYPLVFDTNDENFILMFDFVHHLDNLAEQFRYSPFPNNLREFVEDLLNLLKEVKEINSDGNLDECIQVLKQILENNKN